MNQTQKIHSFTFAFLILSMTWIYGQEDVPDLITDRPDQTESSATVPVNSLQIETGFVFEGADIEGGILQSTTYNTSLIRFGLFHNAELRLGLEYLGEKFKPQQGGETKIEGISPLYLGMKYRLSEEQNWIPEIAFMGSLTMPFTASEDYRFSYVAPAMRLAFAHTLTENIGFGYNLGMEWDGETLDPIYIYSAALGIGLTPQLAMFIESYGSWGQKLPADHRADAGFTFLLMPNFQFDISGGIGISEVAMDYFVGFGLSIRIPH